MPTGVVYVPGCGGDSEKWLKWWGNPSFVDSLGIVSDGNSGELEILYSENYLRLGDLPFSYFLDYQSNKSPIPNLGEGLRKAIERIRNTRIIGQPEIDDVVLICFSMSALIARWYCQNLGAPSSQYASDLAGIALLAPPNRGSILAQIIPDWFIRHVCDQAPSIASNSDLIADLNSATLHPGTPSIVVAGIGCGVHPLLPSWGVGDGVIFRSETYLNISGASNSLHHSTDALHMENALAKRFLDSSAPYILEDVETKRIVQDWFRQNSW
jgi:hypothetical protein